MANDRDMAKEKDIFMLFRRRNFFIVLLKDRRSSFSSSLFDISVYSQMRIEQSRSKQWIFHLRELFLAFSQLQN